MGIWLAFPQILIHRKWFNNWKCIAGGFSEYFTVFWKISFLPPIWIYLEEESLLLNRRGRKAIEAGAGREGKHLLETPEVSWTISLEEEIQNVLHHSSKMCRPRTDSGWMCFEGFASGERRSPSVGVQASHKHLSVCHPCSTWGSQVFPYIAMETCDRRNIRIIVALIFIWEVRREYFNGSSLIIGTYLKSGTDLKQNS